MSQHIALDLISAVQHARDTKTWVVVVCPNDAQMMEIRRNLAAALAPEDRYSGRTASLEGGGTISVVCQVDEPFQPDGQPISVLFLGTWADTSGMDKWRKAAQQVL